MTPAGQLKYSLIFFEEKKTKTLSGEVEKQLIEVFKCKGAKIKNAGDFVVDAKELFHNNEITFKLRNNKLLTESLIVEFETKKYSINFIDKNLNDNTSKITLVKINK